MALAVAVMLTVTVGTGPGRLGQRAASATTSYRLSGMEWAWNDHYMSTSRSRTDVAMCPAGKQVVGGGARVFGSGDKIALTRLEPFYQGYDDDRRYGYKAAASTLRTDPSYVSSVGDWALHVVAYCADPVPGWHIVRATTSSSSTAMQATAAVCPSGQKVMGTGGAISFYWYRDLNGRLVPADYGIGLQVVRASGDGGLARAQAHEVPEGYSFPWQVTASAVCADTPSGYQVVYGDTHTIEPGYQFGSAVCPWYVTSTGSVLRKQRINMGAAVDDTAPGNVLLSYIAPQLWDNLDPDINTRAEAWENTPTSASWSLAVQNICVSLR